MGVWDRFFNENSYFLSERNKNRPLEWKRSLHPPREVAAEVAGCNLALCFALRATYWFYLVSPNLTGEGDWVKGGCSGFAHPPAAAQCWGCWAHLGVSQLCNLLSWLLQVFLLQLPLSSIWFILILYSILHCFLLVPGWISQDLRCILREDWKKEAAGTGSVDNRLSAHGKLVFRDGISSEILMVLLCGQEEKPGGLSVINCISLAWESFSASAINLFSCECKRVLEIISLQSLLLFLMDSRMSWLLCVAFLHTNLGLNPAEYSVQLKAKSLLKQRQGEQWGSLSCKWMKQWKREDWMFIIHTYSYR